MTRTGSSPRTLAVSSCTSCSLTAAAAFMNWLSAAMSTTRHVPGKSAVARTANQLEVSKSFKPEFVTENVSSRALKRALMQTATAPRRAAP